MATVRRKSAHLADDDDEPDVAPEWRGARCADKSDSSSMASQNFN